MKIVSKNQIIIFSVTLLVIFILSGCASLSASKTTSIKNNSKILIMPPHDVVQRGVAHAAGKGTGKQLQKAVQRELKRVSDYDIEIFDANDKFNYTNAVDRQEAIFEAKNMGVDYCLILTLGEFRNAAPMTFRTDFVTLEDGILIDVNTEKEVWSLDKPFKLDSGTNLGDHYGLIDDIAKAVAESISQR